MIRFIPDQSRKLLSWQLSWFILWLGVTACAIYLHPKGGGHGTHTELGLPPCLSVVLFGRPCPGCGLTTSFTAFVHGDFALAFSAHPFGPILYSMLAIAGLTGIVCYIRHIRIDTATPSFARVSCAFVILFLAFGIARFILSPHYGDHDPYHQWYVAQR